MLCSLEALGPAQPSEAPRGHLLLREGAESFWRRVDGPSAQPTAERSLARSLLTLGTPSPAPFMGSLFVERLRSRWLIGTLSDTASNSRAQTHSMCALRRPAHLLQAGLLAASL